MKDTLGLDKSAVVLQPHDPAWMALGQAECATVRRLLGALAIDVVHVGSTSVAGLDAKPILDIVVSVDDRLSIDDVVASLAQSGEYSYEGDKREDGGLLFVRGTGPFRTAHVHVVGSSSEAWRLYLRFHDLLLADSGARERYQREKRKLAQQFPNDRLSYTNAKSAVIEDLLAGGREGPTAQ